MINLLLLVTQLGTRIPGGGRQPLHYNRTFWPVHSPAFFRCNMLRKRFMLFLECKAKSIKWNCFSFHLHGIILRSFKETSIFNPLILLNYRNPCELNSKLFWIKSFAEERILLDTNLLLLKQVHVTLEEKHRINWSNKFLNDKNKELNYLKNSLNL